MWDVRDPLVLKFMYMVSTRAKSKAMSLSEQHKQQFQELLQPLVLSVADLSKSNENLSLLIPDIKKDLVGSITKQGEEIAKVYEKVNVLSNSNNNLANALAECEKKIVTSESHIISQTTLENRFQEIENQLVEKNYFNEKICDFESKLAAKDNIISSLQQNIYEMQRYHKETITHFENKCDDLEQYGRRPSLRLDGIPSNKDETPDSLEKAVSNCFTLMGVEYCLHDIDRMHRVGKASFNKFTKRMEQQVIIKFKSWDSRCAVYNSRPRRFMMSDDDRNKVTFSVKLDLTSKRNNLLKESIAAIKGNTNFSYVFADINCHLVCKTANGEFKYFNNGNQFYGILNAYQWPSS